MLGRQHSGRHSGAREDPDGQQGQASRAQLTLSAHRRRCHTLGGPVVSRTASRVIAAMAALVLAAATVSPALIVGSCVGKAASCAWPSFADRIFSSGGARSE